MKNLSYNKLLSIQAHNYATQKYCDAIGLKSKVKEDGSVVCYADNQQTCELNNIPVSGQYKPFLYPSNTGYVPEENYKEWLVDRNTNKGICVKSLSVVRDFCHTFKDRRGNQTIGYFPGNIQCNMTGGYCSAVSEEEPDIPSCIITPDYCDAFSASYSYSPGNLGSCYLPDGQRFAENMVSTTITRAYRDNVDQAIRACSNPNNPQCYLAAVQVLVAPILVVGDFAKEWWSDNSKKIGDRFNQLYNNPTPYNMAEFAASIVQSFPLVYWGFKLANICAGLLDTVVGSIPGLNLIIPAGFFGKVSEFLYSLTNINTWVSLGMKFISGASSVINYIANFNLDELERIGNAILNIGSSIIDVIDGVINSLGLGPAKLIIYYIAFGPVVFLLQILLSNQGLKVLDSVFGRGGYVSRLFTGDFNKNIKDFFATTVGQKFFYDMVWKGGLEYAFVDQVYGNGLKAAYDWVNNLF
jgi:hypothetical protein